jgi:hypothetical protein
MQIKLFDKKIDLFKTMTGSKLYGTSTPTSDIDYKVITLPSSKDMLIGKRPKNNFISTGNAAAKNTQDDVDLEYVPIQVFLTDAWNCQSYAFDLVFSCLAEDQDYAGQTYHNEEIRTFMKEICEEFVARYMTCDLSSMIGFASSQATKYGVKGDRLNVVNSVTSALEEVYTSLLAQGRHRLVIDEMTLRDVALLHEKFAPLHNAKYFYKSKYPVNNIKMDDCYVLIDTCVPWSIKMKTLDDRLKSLAKRYGNRASQAAINEGVDYKSLSHALRVALDAHELLDTGWLKLPHDKERVEYLLKVKSGNIELRQTVDELGKMFDDCKTKIVDHNHVLHEKTPELQRDFEQWAEEVILNLYEMV